MKAFRNVKSHLKRFRLGPDDTTEPVPTVVTGTPDSTSGPERVVQEEGRDPAIITKDRSPAGIACVDDIDTPIGSPKSNTGVQSTWTKLVHTRPEGSINSLIFHHLVHSMVSGTFWCWTYVSRGLDTVGQKEIIISIRQRESTEGEKDYPIDPLRWFEDMYRFAISGQAVDVFGETRFHTIDKFLGRTDFQKAVYVAPLPIPGILENALPSRRLHVIFLTREETHVSDRCGSMRVLSNAGSAERWFPYPFWIDRDRIDYITAPSVAGSILQEMPMMVLNGISALHEESRIVLHVSRDAAAPLQAAVRDLADTEGLLLESFLHADADSCYVWKSGNKKPHIIMVDGGMHNCTNFCFVGFGSHRGPCKWSEVEDGCVGKAHFQRSLG